MIIGDAPVETGHRDEQKDDTSIGDTVFSKSWALSVLVRAVEAVFKGSEGSLKSGEGKGEGGEGETGEEVGKGKREGGEEEREEDSLDKGLEEDLCHLWDASMNSVRYHQLSISTVCMKLSLTKTFHGFYETGKVFLSKICVIAWAPLFSKNLSLMYCHHIPFTIHSLCI